MIIHHPHLKVLITGALHAAGDPSESALTLALPIPPDHPCPLPSRAAAHPKKPCLPARCYSQGHSSLEPTPTCDGWRGPWQYATALGPIPAPHNPSFVLALALALIPTFG